MRQIFIDANIYLEFYRLDLREFSEILPSLEEIADDVFVTKQIRDEVNRNKLNVTLATCQELVKRVDPSKAGLSASLAADYQAKFGQKWPFMLDKPQIQVAKNNFSQLIRDRVTAVAGSTDVVSVALGKILRKAKDCSRDELERARSRRERGNPPGKKGDPLGDQISWEQLKAALSDDDDVWIVTKDTDYSSSFDNVVFLNPSLQEELEELRLRKSDIHVFNSLAAALVELNKSKPFKKPPDHALMTEAEKEERFSFVLADTRAPSSCYQCGRTGTFVNGHWGRSQYGGLTWQFVCNGCGAYYDTGDTYDD